MHLRKAIDESPEPNKTIMIRVVRMLEPDALKNMDSMCKELYSLSNECSKDKTRQR